MSLVQARRGFFKINRTTPQLTSAGLVTLHKRDFARKGGNNSGGGGGGPTNDKDYYKMLGLERDASQSDVKKAYF